MPVPALINESFKNGSIGKNLLITLVYNIAFFMLIVMHVILVVPLSILLSTCLKYSTILGLAISHLLYNSSLA